MVRLLKNKYSFNNFIYFIQFYFTYKINLPFTLDFFIYLFFKIMKL